jgi:hypothetical protein
MIAGFGFQIATLLLFGGLCIEYAIRVDKHPHMIDPFTKEIRSTKRFRYFCSALVFAYLPSRRFVRSLDWEIHGE